MNADGQARVLDVLEEVVSGRIGRHGRGCARASAGVLNRRGVPRFPPVIHCDNQSSRRLHHLEIIANNRSACSTASAG